MNIDEAGSDDVPADVDDTIGVRVLERPDLGDPSIQYRYIRGLAGGPRPIDNEPVPEDEVVTHGEGG